MLSPRRRIPGTGIADYLGLARLALAGPGATVGNVMPRRGLGRERFWEPACVASLNTPPAAAQAQALWHSLRDPLAGGEAPYRPRFVRNDLTTDLVLPALRWLERQGADLRLGHGLIGLGFEGARLAELAFADERLLLGAGDAAILAVPPDAARRLLPDLAAPRTSSAIVTAHFALPGSAAPGPRITGLIDGRSMWLLTRDDLATVTVGAANALLAMPSRSLAHLLWRPAAMALDSDPAALPPYRLLRARQGTFAHTPREYARRPATRNGWSNLFLAGDWTSTGQAATLDGAAQSGHAAAAAITGMSR
jgi:hypothetical protein